MLASHSEPRRHDVLLGALVVAAAAAILVMWAIGFRIGGLMLAGVLAVAAISRLVLPLRRVGALAVRARGWDVAVLATLAVAVGVLAEIVPGR